MTYAPNDCGEMDQAFWDDYRAKVSGKEGVYARMATESGEMSGTGHRLSYGNSSRLRSVGLAAGTAGLTCTFFGTLWLLSMFDWMVPWYSIFPIAALVAGGAFMVAAITYDADSGRQEARSDRCDH